MYNLNQRLFFYITIICKASLCTEMAKLTALIREIFYLALFLLGNNSCIFCLKLKEMKFEPWIVLFVMVYSNSKSHLFLSLYLYQIKSKVTFFYSFSPFPSTFLYFIYFLKFKKVLEKKSHYLKCKHLTCSPE